MQNKCKLYWPKDGDADADKEVIFDEFRIEMQSTLSSTKDYVITKLILEREGETVKTDVRIIIIINRRKQTKLLSHSNGGVFLQVAKMRLNLQSLTWK